MPDDRSPKMTIKLQAEGEWRCVRCGCKQGAAYLNGGWMAYVPPECNTPDECRAQILSVAASTMTTHKGQA